ncbi:MAG: helix-turn-helix transcriptional regulator [Bacteroidota bacterium]
MGVHLGKRIADRLQDLGMSKAEFGRRINTSRQNVSLILQKESLDTRMLEKICKVLDYNFFQYIAYEGSGGKSYSPGLRPKVKLTIELNPEHQAKILDLVLNKDHLSRLEQL